MEACGLGASDEMIFDIKLLNLTMVIAKYLLKDHKDISPSAKVALDHVLKYVHNFKPAGKMTVFEKLQHVYRHSIYKTLVQDGKLAGYLQIFKLELLQVMKPTPGNVGDDSVDSTDSVLSTKDGEQKRP
ncbi:unnamed protein product [Sympodiomycopsis kandeliae]